MWKIIAAVALALPLAATANDAFKLGLSAPTVLDPADNVTPHVLATYVEDKTLYWKAVDANDAVLKLPKEEAAKGVVVAMNSSIATEAIKAALKAKGVPVVDDPAKAAYAILQRTPPYYVVQSVPSTATRFVIDKQFDQMAIAPGEGSGRAGLSGSQHAINVGSSIATGDLPSLVTNSLWAIFDFSGLSTVVTNQAKDPAARTEHFETLFDCYNKTTRQLGSCNEASAMNSYLGKIRLQAVFFDVVLRPTQSPGFESIPMSLQRTRVFAQRIDGRTHPDVDVVSLIAKAADAVTVGIMGKDDPLVVGVPNSAAATTAAGAQ